ncbi:MAG: methyltransferase domain-containing protein [Proteobacteria bacterium]|nr:methyltransferase domain-containing protein [Pseudomonadota bacterium]
MLQNKQQERLFFDNLAKEQEYNVFTDGANQKIIDAVVALLELAPGAQVIDLGCGSGVFTKLLAERGFNCMALDLSLPLLKLGKKQLETVDFIQADVEALPFLDNSIDILMLSCLVHHLPDPSKCAEQAFRVLKPGGKFIAFDPNRLNPFMYLYRDISSPFYSAKGVTPNERPILPWQVRKVFSSKGFHVTSHFVDGLTYRYVASDAAKGLLPLYNFFELYFFKPSWMRMLRSFVFTVGVKQL